MLATLKRQALCLEPQAIAFGRFDHLVGVYQPERTPQRQSFAVVILTAGMLPSSGPFRLHVDLATALAEQGVPSLRFDLSGIGESLAVGSEGTSLERAAAEISAAIDYLQQYQQIHQVALFGLCSGADDALFAALQDDRISGLFAIDGCGYRTPQFYLHRLLQNYLPKLTSYRAWSSRLQRLVCGPQSEPESLRLGSDVREFPDRLTAAKQLHQLVQRGVRLHFHYTGGVGDYYNHAAQFRAMFAGTELATSGALDKIETSFYADSDHVCYLVEHRERLVALATKSLLRMGI